MKMLSTHLDYQNSERREKEREEGLWKRGKEKNEWWRIEENIYGEVINY